MSDNSVTMSEHAITVNQADLTCLNSMQLACISDRLVTLNANANEADIVTVVSKLTALNQPLMVLSGGSNVILPSTLHASVLRPLLLGIEVLSETPSSINIEVMAGENWHELVVETVNNGWYGLENLALIPGLVGAAPVQNIGAYGSQLEDCLTHVRALHIPSLTWHTINKEDCQFDYRDSKFKREAGQWLITKVGFSLHKQAHRVTANYGDVAQLAKSFTTEGQPISPLEIMRAIIEIRQNKLPDPKQLPNCGSFFKNPIISQQQFVQLQIKYPKIVGYKVDETHTKVATGWLIEQAGLKGSGIEPILTHVNQALVLVNHANLKHDKPATQADILATQSLIQNIVKDTFGILLEREPIWIESHGMISNTINSNQ